MSIAAGQASVGSGQKGEQRAERSASSIGPSLTDAEFAQFKKFIYKTAGIDLSPAKKALVAGRLSKRLKHHGLKTYDEYFQLISAPRQADELQMAVDLLTTNETYFFREPKHFEFLINTVLPRRVAGRPFRVWSAACSSGEEPYTLAMVLAETLGYERWEILASDISTRVLEKAVRGQYPVERARHVSIDYLRRYCLKGTGEHDGTLLVERRLREKVAFRQINLNEPLPSVGEFDVIFLRNVMIYFDVATKRAVVQRLAQVLRPGGYFIIGHSESLNGVTDVLTSVAPSIYRKP